MTGAKINFIDDFRKRTAGILTVEQMDNVIRIMTETLDGYQMFEAILENNKNDDLLKCFISAMKVQGRSQKTIDRYAYIIGRLLEHAKVPVRTITVYHIREYLAAEKERGVADSTLEGIREIFSSFYNWLQRESLIEKNPMANMGPIRCEKKERKAYTESDIEKLNRECKTIRDRAIIAFLRSTGCRISEMTGLDRDKVDFVKRECIVYGKGRKERTVCLDDVAAMLVKEYLDSRKDDNPALFVGLRNERLEPGGVRRMLKTAANKAGVENVHPHRFRRTLATSLTRKGMPIQEVAKLLGHEKLETTMKYVVVTTEDMQSSYRRFA